MFIFQTRPKCLVADKAAFQKKYKDIVVDNASVEDIMLFYVKGGPSCED
jgi:ABC-2 type transport system ATP-binding protein